MILQDKNGLTIEIAERTIFYDAPMESEEVKQLMAEIQDSNESIINLFWSCEGGAIHTMMTLVEFIRTQEKFFNITLSGLAMSGGLGFLINAKDLENVCISSVLPSAVVMAHDSDIQLSKRDLKNKNSHSYHMLYERELDAVWKGIHRELLTDDEMLDFERGLDVYVSNARVKEYFVGTENMEKIKIEKIKSFMLSDAPVIECPDHDFSPKEEVADESIDDSFLSDVEILEKIRGFESVGDTYLKHPDVEYQAPRRATKSSAGYDFYSTETITLMPKQRHIVATDVKAYMLPDEVLKLYVRSSAGIKKGLALQNGTGVIDSDYYSNPDNDGNIGIPLVNTLDYPVEIKVGERVAQGVFMKFLVADEDDAEGERIGGTGSTGQQ